MLDTHTAGPLCGHAWAGDHRSTVHRVGCGNAEWGIGAWWRLVALFSSASVAAEESKIAGNWRTYVLK